MLPDLSKIAISTAASSSIYFPHFTIAPVRGSAAAAPSTAAGVPAAIPHAPATMLTEIVATSLRGRNGEGHRHGSTHCCIRYRNALVGKAADERETVDLGPASTVFNDEASLPRIPNERRAPQNRASRGPRGHAQSRPPARASSVSQESATTVRAISALRPE